ncbi:MAG: HlyD family secretion protein [Alphaproteobacteria bacterium]|nr:HlyD family secretion protein [Alphaproteobacteria bacterium]
METLMILTYAAICVAIFKIFKIPLNKWTVPTAVLGGVIMLGTVLLLMNYNHPYTKVAQTIVVTTPIVPDVKGRVIEVPVQPNIPLKQGEVLFRIDPAPYQFEVDRLEALLADATTRAAQLEERLKAAEAATGQARAELVASKSELDTQAREIVEQAGAAVDQVKSALNLALKDEIRYRTLLDKGVVPRKKYEEVQQRVDSLEAQLRQAAAAERQASEKLGAGGDRIRSVQESLRRAEAQEREARLAFDAESGGANPEVRRTIAALDRKLWELEKTVVRAPTDGMVTQLLLRPGMMAVPLPLKPTMVFVHAESARLIASFLQNSFLRLEIGAEAEAIFPAIPGRVFTGKIATVLPVIDRGSVQASGTLISQRLGPPGRVPVGIDLDDDMSSFNLPAGSVAEVAVYTEHVQHVAMIRRILLRMKSWQNFLFSEGH